MASYGRWQLRPGALEINHTTSRRSLRGESDGFKDLARSHLLAAEAVEKTSAIRFCISCGGTSSTCVSNIHLWPKGSLSDPLRSPQNLSPTGSFTVAPA